MHHERLLPIAMAALAWLGTVLLGMGQVDASLPLLMFTVAVTSVYFTDIKGWFRLNRAAAGIGALAAAGMAVADLLFRLGPEHRLVAIANLLVYLQIVLLYQEKTTRRYWLLLVTSLLEVVVAAVLNFSAAFGLVLVVYLFLALATLALFFVHRETGRYPVSYEVGRGLPPTVEVALRAVRTGAPAALDGSTPLAFFALDSPRSSQPMPDWGVLKNTTRMVLTTLVVTVLIFFSLPRFGSGPWRGSVTVPGRVAGLSNTVKLGDLGYVADNPDLVMRVQFVNLETGTPFRPAGDLLLRGAVVTRYESAARRWHQPDWVPNTQNRRLEAAPSRVALVGQHITLEPLSEAVVCCVFPPYLVDLETPVRFDPNRQQLVRSDRFRSGQISFLLGTSGFRAGKQVRITPQNERLDQFQRNALLQPWRPRTDANRQHSRWPAAGDQNAGTRGPLAELSAQAAEVLRQARVPARQRVQAALALTSHLRDSGEFHYSLRPTASGRKDPVVDFVVKRRQGHCEYFASALALMLRSQGIPSRVVIGLKGGDWNAVGSFYRFQQRHAHTWVEVYLAPQHIGDLTPQERNGTGPGGGWLCLDPTPGADRPPSPTAHRLLASVRDTFAYAELLWTSYVVGLNHQRQHDSIYAPLARAVVDALRGIVDAEAWRRRAAWLARLVRDGLWTTWLAGNWFSWRGGLVAVALCLALAGLYRAISIIYRRLRRWAARHRWPGHGRDALAVRFYYRLEAQLKRYGITRSTGATQREFAVAVGGQLRQLPDGRTVASLPRRIADAFYRVRFGRQQLDSQEVETVERALVRLETALRAAGRGRAGTRA